VNPEPPLTGKRIVLTRAQQQAGSLSGALEAVGAKVLHLSTIEIVPPESYAALDAALRSIEKFDWLILTSANAVQAFAGRVTAGGICGEQLARVQVAAVGPATAGAARKHGLRVDLVPEEYVAESLVATLKEQGISGKRVLLARAAVARDVIPQELASLGANVEVVEAYRTILPLLSTGEVRALLAGVLPDAVTFTSSSTVTNFLALVSAAQIELPPGLPAVSIGPITSRTLREHDWAPAAEASEASIPSLVEACVRLLNSSRG
jgi:uroporphyrinogen-III synthase